MDQVQIAKNDQITQFYTPAELIYIFKSILDQQNINQKIVWMKGVYLLGDSANWYNYDKLRDELSGDEITIFISNELKERLTPGNLIMVAGVIDRKSWGKGNFQIQLRVTRVEIVQEQTINEVEIRQIELRNLKIKKGYKNVDAILENKLYTENRPQIALLYADGSITDKDFFAGKETASSRIDFHEYRISFANSKNFASQIIELDKRRFDIISIIRGGGSGLEKVDDLKVLEAVVGMNTPVICAVGHEEDKVFLKNIADKIVPVPHALGTYFKDTVERVELAKKNSQAIMAEQIKKQYIDQINIQTKQNKELQEKLNKIISDNKRSVDTSSKQIEELQKRLKEILDSNVMKDKDAQKQTSELTGQIKKLTEDRSKQDAAAMKQIEALNKQIEASRLQLEKLMRSIQEKDEQIKNLSQRRSGCLGMAAVMIGIVCLFSFLVL
ncbi:exodeoxyribonuclease VII large subunit [uncultured Bacteroides sp.]|uniref:exodeoxyribonuclease VII large subunit n=1 Tax=uncultured Bacteroides sp. TaxID=162156 RepID=UPI002AAC3EFD|nr:exodeoxyribonuclease VII large subunit [uncultured Bacteroides sp.]